MEHSVRVPIVDQERHRTWFIELEISTCTHTNATEFYEKDKDHPTLWRCPHCGSKFPLIGDTDLWADGILVKQKVE